MEKQIKWAGVAMIVAALLMFTRMAPIFAVLPEDMAFPPESTWEMVRLAAIAGSRWQLSHVMGLLAVILFAVAYALHVGAATDQLIVTFAAAQGLPQPLPLLARDP